MYEITKFVCEEPSRPQGEGRWISEPSQITYSITVIVPKSIRNKDFWTRKTSYRLSYKILVYLFLPEIYRTTKVFVLMKVVIVSTIPFPVPTPPPGPDTLPKSPGSHIPL